ncbi:hypothetical protein ACGF5F_29695 [Streptomyces sp. NPDC047821]
MADEAEPTYWFCNSCGEEVQDQFEDCCDDGENEPSYEGAGNG